MKKFQSKLIKVVKLNSKVSLFRFESPEDFNFIPGQFLSVLIEKGVKRSYSIASFNGLKYFDLCIKNKEGLGSKYFWNLKKGDVVNFIGPLGNFKLKGLKDSIFISSGVGITPFIPMIKELSDSDKKVLLIKSFSKKEDSIFDNLRIKNLKTIKFISRDKGHIQDFLEDYIPEGFEGYFYICGMKEMIEGVVNKLTELGFDKKNIFYEKWD